MLARLWHWWGMSVWSSEAEYSLFNGDIGRMIMWDLERQKQEDRVKHSLGEYDIRKLFSFID